MKATIYISADQAKVYEDAKSKLGESISKTFLRCLERELKNAKAETGRIVIDILDSETGRHAKKAFEGRFLVGDANHGEEFQFDPQKTGVSGGGDYSVALTKAGRIAVLEFNDDGEISSMAVHENFEEFKAATTDGTPSYPLYPDALIQAVASEMDIEHIEELDI